ncbi:MULTISPECIES: DUF475 domain-containing protein [unclassified Novosphingobium]|uniref:DUF475 domain-containing protein n=1 Tax=unclassified Novosphingobium TaxID=2644732 RepID=UPI000B2757A9|nr:MULTISPECIES: DUF475 domain-containing protein [unclassified Novosphingobium]MBN9143885.1 DUF475 domain-containing protein [Novosphingobium sp.]MDR6707070.1 hypothetical protein [Novosphingobium sp. 1748]
MTQFLRHFGGSLIFSAVCLALAAAYGWHDTGSISAVGGMIWIVLVLAVLEVSLSFDNAVVNAAVLKDMDAIWRKRFLTWGMLFAVFGTRVAFPLLIVGFTAGLGPVEAVHLSLNEPAQYEAIMRHAHIPIAGFGGAFLAMVGLGFFIDPDKETHWLRWVEVRLKLVGSIKAGEVALLLLALVLIGRWLPGDEAYTLLVSGVFGIVTFIAVEALGHFLESREAARALAGTAVRSGLGGFLYLNVLDSSFSLDGVIGAFALSNNMVIIALGLSIGAIFVRSLTVLLVEQGTLSEYAFLEHGAFWAIIALAAIMLGSALMEIPETVTGLIGAVLIGAALWASVRENRREAA